METLKAVFFKPDPAAQMRKCNALIRGNTRKLDRDIAQLKALDIKTKQFIVAASRRAQRNPARASQAAQETRIFAKELIRIRKQSARLNTSKAQLESVRMQVNEAFAVRKIEGSLKTSTGIMKDVNMLVRLPQLSETMRQLSLELVKAGIIEESIDDALLDDQLLEGEEEAADAEVDKVLQEILQGKLAKVEGPRVEEPLEEPAEEEFEDQEATLEQMRGRLEALKS
ncbi:SNF7 family protein [Coccidioides immitis RS]|uniref:SNF7 family protein n=4 Tax=Coccidioides immitis TaxID=5501 RepID=A0A0E1RUW9_COCIM|nr:SNF7 family protein [Coccidioides immitis RS]KMP02626.1 charged multivesicular body protein 3 [Coccidioides immitis RMSCC 2394]KMU74551.1 charged multivesicular body protein 3 [Coccidioides immitis RMSCC 3703]KMU90553.1 charged multivesicular body protein 3 [Coccidioides immitis H538.4]TPX23143.1 Vacuolar protein-sorting-associated protein 24 [Coccidioides immitis]EAS28584.1 SNF7 family protein [Coccidioides immitis RS]